MKEIIISTLIIIIVIIICLFFFKREPFKSNTIVIPKIIWCFWDTFPLPGYINEYYKHLVNMHPEYRVELYSLTRIRNEMKELIPYLDKLSMGAHKSDLIRLYLLYKNGGIYCDISTIYKTPIDDIFDLSFNGVQGFKPPWKLKCNIIENGFICAPKGNKLIKLWYKEFLKSINLGFDKYKLFFINKYPYETKLNNLLPYLTQHAILYNILSNIAKKDRKKYIKILKPLHFDFQIKNKWNNNKIIELLKNNNDEDFKKIKLIKINGIVRNNINESDLKNIFGL